MGYDMSMEVRPAIDEELIEKLRAKREEADAAFRETLEKHDKNYNEPEVRQANDAYMKAADDYFEAADPGYFRLNIFGMSKYVDAMFELGMVHNAATPDVEWPEYPEDSFDDDSPAMREYNFRRDEAMDVAAGHPAAETIPSYKLGWNDGWLVKPDEIRAALRELDYSLTAHRDGHGHISEETLELMQEDYWKQWIDYLYRAIDHGGFRVW